MGNIYCLHGIKTPSAFYSQIEDATPAVQATALLGMGAGWHVPLFRGVRGIKPEITWRTTQLATLLAECGQYGADLSAGNTDLHYRLTTNLGTRVADATASHMRMRMAKAFQFIQSITARHQQEASAQVRTLALYDGTNAPLVAAGSLALAGTSAAGTFFGLGPVSINGTAIDGVEEMTLDLGVELAQRGQSSEPYDRYCIVKTVNPVVTLRGTTLEGWTSYGVGLALNGSTGLTIYLRKLLADAAGGVCYVAAATAQHISLIGAYGTARVESTTGGGNNEAITGIRIELRANASGADALAINTATAIA